MKNFFANYLVIPKYGTVRDKVFMTRIALGLTAIIFCMAAVTYSAYAFFSHGVSSNTNKLVAANYSLEYTVMVGDQRPQDGVVTADEPETVEPSDLDGTYKLDKPGMYTIVMVKPESAKASTGFCKIEISDASGNSETYYTEQIGKVSSDEKVAPVTTRYILIEVKDGTAFVKLTASWGTCARETIVNDSLTFGTASENGSQGDTESGGQSEAPDTDSSDVTSSETVSSGDASSETVSEGSSGVVSSTDSSTEVTSSADGSTEVTSSEDAVSSQTESTAAQPSEAGTAQ